MDAAIRFSKTADAFNFSDQTGSRWGELLMYIRIRVNLLDDYNKKNISFVARR